MQGQSRPAEAFYVAQRSRAVVSCSLRGTVDPELLAAAFAAKVAEHPPLQCHVVPVDDGWQFRPLPPDEQPVLQVEPAAGVEQDLEREWNDHLTPSGPLVRARLFLGDDEHAFALSLDHGIADGHSGIALFRAVWDTYRTLLQRGPADPPTVRPRPWPAPVPQLLPPADPQQTQAYLAGRIARVQQGVPSFLPYDAVAAELPGGVPPVGVRRIVLEPEAAARLRHRARQAGSSVHGVVAAAALLAVRSRLGDPGAARGLAVLSPVDLRARLSPPLEAEVMVPAVSSYWDAVTLTGEEDVLAVAGGLTSRLRAAVAGGDVFQELRLMPFLATNPLLIVASTIVTGAGAHDPVAEPEGLQILDVRLVPPREQYYPQAGRGPLMACLTSFGGRLSIELPYSRQCFAEATMTEVAQSLRGTVLAVADAVVPHGAPGR